MVTQCSAADLYPDGINVRYFRFARHALLNALHIIRLKPGDKVLVPGFICRDLLAPIHAVGAVPLFYDIDVDMRPVSLPESEEIRAVLVVNYFGFPQDIFLFRSYCDRHGVVLIEDNAHGYLSGDEFGTLLGKRGDIGIFSIRKTFLLPDGAMLMVNKADWQSRMDLQLPFRDELLLPAFLIKHVLSSFPHQTGISLLVIAQDIVRKIRLWLTGYAVAPMRWEDEFEMPLTPAPHHYSMSALQKLNVFEEVNRRRRLYQEFSSLLSTMDVHPVFDVLPAGTVPYGYPFYADVKVAQQVTSIARSQGFDCIHWPELPMAVEPEAPIHYRTLWLVNFLC